QRTKVKITDLEARIKDRRFLKISQFIDNIEDTLRYQGREVTHYTSIDTAKWLILRWSPFRASEACYMNDPSEGTALLEFFGDDFPYPGDIEAGVDQKDFEPAFVKKPFISSFVPVSAENDLSMWRFYGKGVGDEANGCSISIDIGRFQHSLVKNLDPFADESEVALRNQEFQFYKVAYFKKFRKGNSFKYKIAPNDETRAEKNFVKMLEENLENLREALGKEYARLSPKYKVRVHQRLMKIANLFKFADYQHEKEVRLVVPDVGFRVQIADQGPIPRAFIEFIPFDTCLTRVTIGPKAAGKVGWNAALRYHLDNSYLDHVVVKVSALPYR
ncbi:MAG: DUF2971 domain-containing protein, partial [Bacteroidota bacterium]